LIKRLHWLILEFCFLKRLFIWIFAKNKKESG
jgi:hypothetical protein